VTDGQFTITNNNYSQSVLRFSDRFSRLWATVVDFLDLRLLLDPVYVNIAIGISVSFFADITFCTLLPLAILKLGYSRADTALCISIIAATDIFGRLCVAFIGAFCPRITSRVLLFGGVVTSVIGRISTSMQINVALGGVVVSVLGTGPKVRRFKPGRGRWILRVIKSVARLPSEGK
jgi:hypothetical protein